MLFRRINAIISLLTTVLLLDHAIIISVWMLSRGSVEQSAPTAARILVCLMGLHALISIFFAIRSHRDSDGSKVKNYPKLNRATYFQRVSGILLIVFTALHIAGAADAMQPPQIVHAILHPLFFTIALAHAAVSTDKAFITLGIGNAKFVKGVSIAIKVICAATLIASISGFYLFVC